MDIRNRLLGTGTLLILLATVIGLAGCGKKADRELMDYYSAGSTEEKIYEKLYKKYDKEFIVENCESKSGNSFLQSGNITATVKEINSEDTFTASLQDDTNELDDNYASVFYKNEIDEKLDSIINETSEITIENYTFVYFTEKENWVKKNDVDYFLSNTGSNAQFTISIEADTNEETASLISSFIERIENQHMNYRLDCNCIVNGNIGYIALSKSHGEESLSKEKILNKLEQEYKNE